MFLPSQVEYNFVLTESQYTGSVIQFYTLITFNCFSAVLHNLIINFKWKESEIKIY